MGIITFLLMGGVSGGIAGWAFFAFGDKKEKYISGASGVAVTAVEAYVALKAFMAPGQDPAPLILALISSHAIAFVGVIILFAYLLEKQDARFKITIIDVIFSNSKALSAYHDSRKAEIDGRLKKELNIEAIEKSRADLEEEISQFRAEESLFKDEVNDARALLEQRGELIDSKFSIVIPQKYKHCIKPDFFELLPRHTQKVGAFYAKLRPLTEQFIKNDHGLATNEEVFDSYLLGVASYVRTCLFDQAANTGENEVRVHFRKLDSKSMVYKAHVVLSDLDQAVSDLKVDNGLIKASQASRRSLVYSANKKDAYSTGSEHLWQDYLTYVFEQIKDGEHPRFTFGISVRHKAVYSNLLYFLSFIQIEQIIQQDMIRLHNHLSKNLSAKVA
ncbi:hypothetical protein E6B08_20250 [Pseudomonas putida]|uniref:Uncharacterized protein n=1 Tax=Pseudomonas putida TaxID=303 RepID=A0A4D6XHB4_PSEPU|nr:hypothetical protein [Pseudomonas putida]QCI13541.1 hypothetical protein E6B08_20250 [Pseudomonas putida]